MKYNAFFWGAVWLVIAALITHSIARTYIDEAMHRKGAQLTQMVKFHTPYKADPLALEASRMWNVLTVLGMVLTGLSIVCAVTAVIRRETGYYLIWLLLLSFAITLPLLA